ncbi:MAG: hypothetical protein VX392_02320 [Verrucomicrobiota bacterium]|nr:hypothetical protein [Verrucomicrobiota bacterium]
MSDEPIQSADSDAPPVIPPVSPPPIVPPPLPPKAVTPAWVFNLLRIVLVALLTGLATTGIILLFRKAGWEGIWKLTLIGTCSLFAVMSILVIVGGAMDIRKLFRRLREREAIGDEDPGS